ncbi:hypothetical protein [Bacillus sp. 2205SS5-2]
MGKRKSSPRLATTSVWMLLLLVWPFEPYLYVKFLILENRG